MPAFIGPHATVLPYIVLPEDAQLGQKPAFTTLNPEFPNPIKITESRQVLVIGPVGSRTNGVLTAVYGQGETKDEVYIYTGCYGGVLDDFEAAVVKRKLPGNVQRSQYELTIEYIRRMISFRQPIAGEPKSLGDDYGGC